MIREILYPKIFAFSFKKHSYYFVLAMCFATFIGYIVTIPKLFEFGFSDTEIAFRTLDLITIAIPPALPAVLSSCILFGIRRLNFN